MWKCPSCGAMSRGAECTSCGLSRPKGGTYRPALSAMRFFALVMAACAVLAAVFLIIHITINERHRKHAEALNQTHSYEHYGTLTPEEQDAIREADRSQ